MGFQYFTNCFTIVCPHHVLMFALITCHCLPSSRANDFPHHVLMFTLITCYCLPSSRAVCPHHVSRTLARWCRRFPGFQVARISESPPPPTHKKRKLYIHSPSLEQGSTYGQIQLTKQTCQRKLDSKHVLSRRSNEDSFSWNIGIVKIHPLCWVRDSQVTSVVERTIFVTHCHVEQHKRRVHISV